MMRWHVAGAFFLHILRGDAMRFQHVRDKIHSQKSADRSQCWLRAGNEIFVANEHIARMGLNRLLLVNSEAPEPILRGPVNTPIAESPGTEGFNRGRNDRPRV